MLNKQPIILDWANESLAWKEFTVERDGKRHWCFQDAQFIEAFCRKDMYNACASWKENLCFEGTNIINGVKRVDAEVDSFFLEIGFKHNRSLGGYEMIAPSNKRIALFAHQGIGMAFLSSLLDIPYPIFCTKFDMGHSGVTVIFFDERKEFIYPKVLQLSNDSHLYKEDILKGYNSWLDI